MKTDVALIIISVTSLFGVILFFLVSNVLKKKVDELVLSQKLKKKTRSSSRKS
ncbi:hypothetical protein MCEGEM19_00327 [Candidatus Pelagibacterales bacterium]|jgi:hypothetical protein